MAQGKSPRNPLAFASVFEFIETAASWLVAKWFTKFRQTKEEKTLRINGNNNGSELIAPNGKNSRTSCFVGQRWGASSSATGVWGWQGRGLGPYARRNVETLNGR